MERLQKVIAAAGICSRRKAEEYIVSGKVKVNGVVVTTLGTKVDGNDSIEVDGQLLNGKQEKVTYVFYKPKNVISSVSDEKDRETVLDYFNGLNQRLYPIGRLDYESSGLLLVSNDGELTNLMIHPKYHVGKVYEVTIDGLLSDDDLNLMRKGMEILNDKTGEYEKTAPCKVSVEVIKPDKPLMKLKITLYEGKNRQIRRMIAYFGYNVERLCRVEFGHIKLGLLKPGQFRRLTKDERNSLIKHATVLKK